MKKYLLIFLLFLTLFMLCGCKQLTAYRLYGNKKFILETPGVYKNGNEYVYVNGGTITMNFSDARISFIGEKYRIDYEDGCFWDCMTGGCHSDTMQVSHLHDSSVGSLVKEYNHVQTPLGLAEKGQYAFLLIISVAGTIGSGIFVLKPSYIPRVAKWNNSIFPMYKEPFEPSDLYIGLHLLGSVIGFLAFLILSIILIAALF